MPVTENFNIAKQLNQTNGGFDVSTVERLRDPSFVSAKLVESIDRVTDGEVPDFIRLLSQITVYNAGERRLINEIDPLEELSPTSPDSKKDKSLPSPYTKEGESTRYGKMHLEALKQKKQEIATNFKGKVVERSELIKIYKKLFPKKTVPSVTSTTDTNKSDKHSGFHDRLREPTILAEAQKTSFKSININFLNDRKNSDTRILEYQDRFFDALENPDKSSHLYNHHYYHTIVPKIVSNNDPISINFLNDREKAITPSEELYNKLYYKFIVPEYRKRDYSSFNINTSRSQIWADYFAVEAVDYWRNKALDRKGRVKDRASNDILQNTINLLKSEGVATQWSEVHHSVLEMIDEQKNPGGGSTPNINPLKLANLSVQEALTLMISDSDSAGFTSSKILGIINSLHALNINPFVEQDIVKDDNPEARNILISIDKLRLDGNELLSKNNINNIPVNLDADDDGIPKFDSSGSPIVLETDTEKKIGSSLLKSLLNDNQPGLLARIKKILNIEKSVEFLKTTLPELKNKLSRLSPVKAKVVEFFEKLKTDLDSDLSEDREELKNLQSQIDTYYLELNNEEKHVEIFGNLCEELKTQYPVFFNAKNYIQKQLELTKVVDGLTKLTESEKVTLESPFENLPVFKKLFPQFFEVNSYIDRIKFAGEILQSIEKQKIKNGAPKEVLNALTKVENSLRESVILLKTKVVQNQSIALSLKTYNDELTSSNALGNLDDKINTLDSKKREVEGAIKKKCDVIITEINGSIDSLNKLLTDYFSILDELQLFNYDISGTADYEYVSALIKSEVQKLVDVSDSMDKFSPDYAGDQSFSDRILSILGVLKRLDLGWDELGKIKSLVEEEVKAKKVTLGQLIEDKYPENSANILKYIQAEAGSPNRESIEDFSWAIKDRKFSKYLTQGNFSQIELFGDGLASVFHKVGIRFSVDQLALSEEQRRLIEKNKDGTPSPEAIRTTMIKKLERLLVEKPVLLRMFRTLTYEEYNSNQKNALQKLFSFGGREKPKKSEKIEKRNWGKYVVITGVISVMAATFFGAKSIWQWGNYTFNPPKIEPLSKEQILKQQRIETKDLTQRKAIQELDSNKNNNNTERQDILKKIISIRKNTDFIDSRIIQLQERVKSASSEEVVKINEELGALNKAKTELQSQIKNLNNKK